MMKTSIALAAALSLVFAVAGAGLAQDRPATTHSGKLKDGKVKRSLPLRTSPPSPETQGGTLDENKGAIVYF